MHLHSLARSTLFPSKARSAPLASRAAGALVASVALLVGCGGGDEPGAAAETVEAPAAGAPATPASQGRRGGPAPVAATGTEPSGSDELGGLHGTILFSGKAPARFPLGAKDLSECGHHPEVDQRSNVLVVNDGKLANVLVTLKSGWDEGNVPAPAAPNATLDQRGCMYVPRVMGIQLGQKLLVKNSDPTSHNVHAKPKRNPEFNRNMGAQQPALELAFERAEMVPFSCDIHPWMGAAVFVEEHPWFAVTDENGAFRIAGIPPGDYVVEARHEHRDVRSVAGTVTVKPGESQGFTMTLTMAD